MRHTRVAVSMLLAAVAASATGCMTAPAPVAGDWHLTRTLDAQPAGCMHLNVNAIDVSIDPDATPAIVVTDATLFENGDEQAAGSGTVFTTEEYALEEAGRPILIRHDLTVIGDALVGTASADGDGDDVGCRYDLTVTGVRR